MEQKLVSVIVPVYNVENYVNHCIETVVNQTYSNLEIILVDDGSTDCSGNICDQFAEKDRRIVVIHQENKGLSAARNTGLKTAKGEYICFIDSDDYISPEYVEILLNTALIESSDIVICKYIQGDKYNFQFCQNEDIQKPFTVLSTEALSEWHGKYKDLETVAWNKLYKKSLFETGILYPEGRYFEDVPTTHRLVYEARKVCFISNRLYYYYQRGNSIQNSLSDEKIVHKLRSQEERLMWFENNGFHNSYIRLFSKYLKYHMVCYLMACDNELCDKIYKSFIDNYNVEKKDLTCIDRIIFSLFCPSHRIIRWGYRVLNGVS